MTNFLTFYIAQQRQNQVDKEYSPRSHTHKATPAKAEDADRKKLAVRSDIEGLASLCQGH